MLPKLIELGPITIHSYGLLLVAGVLSAISLGAWLAEKQAIPRNYAWDLGFIIVISAVLGAKLMLVLTDLGTYMSNPSLFLTVEFWRAGGVYYGGLLAAIGACTFYILRHGHIPYWKSADAAAPAIALGQTIGRVGCFAAGCDYGKPTDVPWGVTFTDPYANELSGVPLNVPLHPAQLYESGVTLFICFVLLFFFFRRRFDGQVFALYLILYSAGRFILEYFRGDVDRGFVFGVLSTSQFISVLLFPLGLVLMFSLYQRRQRVARA